MILLIGDLHVTEKNCVQFEQLTKRVQDLLLTRPISHVILLGDILDNHGVISRQAMYSVSCFIESIAVQVPCTVLVGNHDMDHNKRFCEIDCHWMQLLKHVDNVTVIDRPRVINMDGANICCVPYVPPGRFREAIETFQKDFQINADACDLVVAHQEFANGKLSDSIISSCLEPYDFMPLCVSGHLHKSHTISGTSGGGSVVYTGSAFSHSFGQGKCWLWLYDTRTSTLDRIENCVEEKRSMYVALTDLESIDKSCLSKNIQLHVQAKSVGEFNTWIKSADGRELSGLCKIKLALVKQTQQQELPPTGQFDDQLMQRINEAGLFDMYRHLTGSSQISFEII